MDPTNLLAGIRALLAEGVAYSKPVVIIITSVLALTYVCIVAVALFYPDKERRADARFLLLRHRLTRVSHKRKV